jgi:hypothetical protein
LGEVIDVAPGNALFRVNVELNNFPNAICNDGSGAVFYVRQASNQADRNKWHIHLQGGGGCRDGQSCVAWHTANQPGTEWKCADTDHVMEHHITTPYFTRIDLQDSLKVQNYVESGFGTSDDAGQAIYNALLNLPNLDTFAEEGSVMSGGPPSATPGIFGPQCTQHVGLTSNHAFFDVKIPVGLVRYSAHDVLWNWWTGQQPQQVVYPYIGPGPAPTCN